jgi:hypothetical protein
MPTSLSLLEILADIPDPRHAQGRRHPLSAILGLTVLAMLTGCKTYEAIVQFGRQKGVPLAHALGFRRGKTPCKSTFSEIFRALDVVAFEATLSRWIGSRTCLEDTPLVCLDGKTARGSKDGAVPGQHLLAAYAPHAQAVLAQVPVDAKTNEHKAALGLLGIIPIRGRIVTGDAMFCQKSLCAKIIEGGGDYLLTVKDNQPSLAVDIQAGLAFEDQTRQRAAAFSPGRDRSATGRFQRRPQQRQGPWAAGKTDVAADHDPHQESGMGRSQARIRARA